MLGLDLGIINGVIFDGGIIHNILLLNDLLRGVGTNHDLRFSSVYPWRNVMILMCIGFFIFRPWDGIEF